MVTGEMLKSMRHSQCMAVWRLAEPVIGQRNILQFMRILFERTHKKSPRQQSGT